jgi:hypothetical protein
MWWWVHQTWWFMLPLQSWYRNMARCRGNLIFFICCLLKTIWREVLDLSSYQKDANTPEDIRLLLGLKSKTKFLFTELPWRSRQRLLLYILINVGGHTTVTTLMYCLPAWIVYHAWQVIINPSLWGYCKLRRLSNTVTLLKRSRSCKIIGEPNKMTYSL